MKRALALLLSASLTLSLAACGGGGGGTSQAGGSSGPASSGGTGELTATQQIIQEAQGMTLEELAQKAIEESNGQKFYGVGNSSRGATALPLFVEYLQSIDPSYTLEFEWQQPKNNKIFDQLTSDSLKDTGTFAMTLIQDGNQIESKMVQTGILDTFIPKDWADANGTTAEEYNGYLPLQTLNKVFMYNNTGSKTFDNCWDFVGEDAHGLFMDIDSELVGKNFLYMLTEDTYAGWLKDAFEALSAEEQAYFQPTIDEMASEAESLGLGENGKYALAWIKLWVGSYNAQTDDGPICNTLVDQSATDQFGLLVYSKLRSVEESATVSKNNITVAAYNDGYTGIGGFGYCHYLFVTDNSPLPWTACAFIAYMTCTADGFSAWGKDIGGYSSNPLRKMRRSITIRPAAWLRMAPPWSSRPSTTTAMTGGPPTVSWCWRTRSTAPPWPSQWAAGSRCWTATRPAELPRTLHSRRPWSPRCPRAPLHFSPSALTSGRKERFYGFNPPPGKHICCAAQ